LFHTYCRKLILKFIAVHLVLKSGDYSKLLSWQHSYLLSGSTVLMPPWLTHRQTAFD